MMNGQKNVKWRIQVWIKSFNYGNWRVIIGFSIKPLNTVTTSFYHVLQH